jgi:site-specific recombinase XerC
MELRKMEQSLERPRENGRVKQQLATVRMMFDWLVVGQIVPANPASTVRGPKHVVKTGKTPVLEAEEWRKLLDCGFRRCRCAICATGR